MNETVKAALEAELATIKQVVDHAQEPFGYGTDIWCETDLHPRMLEVDGFATLALAQALVRRLDCPRGQLLDDPDYGLDIRGMLNRGLTAAELRAMPGQIRSELEKDDRVDQVVVTLSPSSTGSSLLIKVAVSAVDSRLGDFALTLNASSAEVLLEELAA